MSAGHLTDTEFNLQWVFEQMCNIDTGDAATDAAPDALPRIKSSPAPGSSSSDRVLSISHLRHVFTNFLRVNLSDDELEEVLIMLDDNQDGKVTKEDFMHSMQITPQSPFDPRYALHLPWSALDSTTKDGLLTEEDSHAARQALGKMWGLDNEAEWNAVVREIGKIPNERVPQLHVALEAAPISPTLGERGHSSQPSASVAGAGSSSSMPLRKPGMHLDRDHFRRIVSTLAVAGSGEMGFPALAKQPSHVAQAPSFTQMHSAGLHGQSQLQHQQSYHHLSQDRHGNHGGSISHNHSGSNADQTAAAPALSIHFSPASSPVSPAMQPHVPSLALDVSPSPLDSPPVDASPLTFGDSKPAPLPALTPSLSHAAAGVPQPPHTTRPAVSRTPSKPAVEAPTSQSTRNRRVVASSKQGKLT